MKLGIIAGYSGAQMGLPMELILEAEKCGFDSIWTGEAYGSDVITPLAWIGALTKRSNSRRYHADARPLSRDDCDDRDDPRCAFGRTLHPRRRTLGAAGRRGMGGCHMANRFSGPASTSKS